MERTGYPDEIYTQATAKAGLGVGVVGATLLAVGSIAACGVDPSAGTRARSLRRFSEQEPGR